LEQKLQSSLSYSDVSKYFTREAITFITSNPSQFLRLITIKTLMFWGRTEIPHNKEINCERENSIILKIIPTNFPFVLSLAITGLILMFSNIKKIKKAKKSNSLNTTNQYEIAAIMLLFILIYYVSFLPFFMAARYRVPVLPALFLFAAYGIFAITQMIHKRAYIKASGWIIGILLLFGLTSIDASGYKPYYQDWHSRRGDHFIKLGENKKAIQEFKQVLEYKSDNIHAHRQLADLYFENRDLKKAISHCTEILQLEPNDLDSRFNLGTILLELGNLSEAIEQFLLMLEQNPQDYKIHNKLGTTYGQLGEFEKAIDHFTKALQINSNYDKAHVNLGIAYANQGQNEKAIKHIQKALMLNPNNQSATYMLKQLELKER